MVFGRSEALEIRTILQAALYDVINKITRKERTWEVEVVVNARVENTSISVRGLVPSNVIHYVRKFTQYNDQNKLWYNIGIISLDNMNYYLNN